MSIKNGMMMFTMIAVVGTFAAAPEVTDVVAKQRYPWNGLVDITCKVTGINGVTNGLYFTMAAVEPDSGNTNRVWCFGFIRNGARSPKCEVHTNGNYRLLWDAQADLGEVNYSNMVVRITLGENKVQLWEEGPYWAVTNVGADAPWESGYYFWWGDTIGYKRENDTWVASDGSVPNFEFDGANTPTFGKHNGILQREGWITADTILAPEYDAAHVHWGSNWRMPTKQELDDLNNKCDWTWTTVNGVNGYAVKGRGTYASASIFLPAAGYGEGTSLYRAGSFVYYRSSVPTAGNYNGAWDLRFDSRGHDAAGYSSRLYGQSIRPLQGFTE